MGFFKTSNTNQELLAENAQLRSKLKESETNAETLRERQATLEEQIEALQRLEAMWQSALVDHQKAREKYNALVSEAQEIVEQLRQKRSEAVADNALDNNENKG